MITRTEKEKKHIFPYMKRTYKSIFTTAVSEVRQVLKILFQVKNSF